MHGGRVIDLRGVGQCYVEIRIHEGECQLAQYRIEVRVTRHGVGDRQQSFQDRLVLAYQLVADIVRNDLLITQLNLPYLTIEGICCQRRQAQTR